MLNKRKMFLEFVVVICVVLLIELLWFEKADYLLFGSSRITEKTIDTDRDVVIDIVDEQSENSNASTLSFNVNSHVGKMCLSCDSISSSVKIEVLYTDYLSNNFKVKDVFQIGGEQKDICVEFDRVIGSVKLVLGDESLVRSLSISLIDAPYFSIARVVVMLLIYYVFKLLMTFLKRDLINF